MTGSLPLRLPSEIRRVDSLAAEKIVNAFQIYQTIDPALVTDMFQWIRENDCRLYKTAVATLAAERKLRPVFIEKKSVPDQIASLPRIDRSRPIQSCG